MAQKITSDNLQALIATGKPVVLDFWATWCGPCRMVAPVIEALATEYDGRAIVGKLNVDEEMELARKYRVASIPTLIVFKDGQEVTRSVGVIEKEDILDLLGL